MTTNAPARVGDGTRDLGRRVALVAVAAVAALIATTLFTRTVAGMEADQAAYRADQDTVAATLGDRYGATLPDATDLPTAPGQVTTDVVVRLPAGLSRCDVVVETGVRDVGLLCGTGRTEPARR